VTEIVIEAGATRLVLAPGEDGRLHQLHFGPPEAGPRPDLPLALYPLAFPTSGEEPLREPALRVTHADGAVSTRLRFDGATQAPAADGDGTDHRIRLVDRVAPLAVTLCYRTRPDVDAVEQWVEVANEGDAPCRLHQAASGAPALAGPAPHLTHWGGGWAGELQSALAFAEYVLEVRGGPGDRATNEAGQQAAEPARLFGG
jgi:alpha-galactosidase